MRALGLSAGRGRPPLARLGRRRGRRLATGCGTAICWLVPGRESGCGLPACSINRSRSATICACTCCVAGRALRFMQQPLDFPHSTRSTFLQADSVRAAGGQREQALLHRLPTAVAAPVRRFFLADSLRERLRRRARHIRPSPSAMALFSTEVPGSGRPIVRLLRAQDRGPALSTR